MQSNATAQQQANYLRGTFGSNAMDGNNELSNNMFTHNRTGSMPTASLLPQSLFPTSSSFASSSTMNIPVVSPQTMLNQLHNANKPTTMLPSSLNSIAGGSSNPSSATLPGLYSTTGFDMVGILARVAARRDPKTVLGPIDCSCSFTVVDIRKYDHPIVYASPTFTTLTGYESHEVVGRNCRFLQSPNGDVVKGSRRKYTDNVAVAHIKRLLSAGKECQASLINYRKGGTPL